MKLSHGIIAMFVGSFVINFFLVSPIMVNKRAHITNNIGKAYMSVIMALFMVLLEIMMHDNQYHVLSMKSYLFVIAGIIVFVYLYRNQVLINDKQYLEGMIEHHSMALLTSDEILKKTNNYEVAKIAKNIIQNQTDEIEQMKKVIKKYDAI